VTEPVRDDADLLAALRREPALMGLLYERHAPDVHRYLARRAGGAAADDLLADVFVAALAARKRVVPHESGSALPWLYGIARNILRRYLRQSARANPPSGPPGLDWDAVDSRLDAQSQQAQLRKAIDVLSESERDVLLLVAWEGLTPAEAGAALGISAVAARSRLHRARLRAQNVLADRSLERKENLT